MTLTAELTKKRTIHLTKKFSPTVFLKYLTYFFDSVWGICATYYNSVIVKVELDKGHPLSTYAKFPRKLKLLTRTRAYHGVRNVSFSEKFACVPNGWPHMASVKSWAISSVDLLIENNYTFSYSIWCVNFKLGEQSERWSSVELSV